MFDKLPPIFKNFYFIVGVLFLIFFLFISDSNLLTQYKLSRKLSMLEKQKSYYTLKIEEVKKDRAELLSNETLLEKFAREKYLMKKDHEDIYVIVEE